MKIDLLPQAPRDAICALYDRGLTWKEIEDRSAAPYSKKWGTDGGGFIHWDALDLGVLEQFPEMRLPKSSLHRWFDLRVNQARKQVLEQTAKAREFAASFLGRDLAGTNSAVVNALRDMVFGLVETSGAGDKAQFLDGLKDLTLALTRIQRVDLQARRVAVEEKAIQMKLDLIKQKAGTLLGSIENADGAKAPQLTREELLEKVREIYGAV